MRVCRGRLPSACATTLLACRGSAVSVCYRPVPLHPSPAAGRAGDLRSAVVAAEPEAAGALGAEALAAALAAARAGLSRHQALALARRLAPGAAAVPVDALLRALLDA
jgi:hypothetical protein